MYPFFHIGSKEIPTYGVMFAIGMFVAAILAAIRCRKRGIKAEDVIYCACFIFVGAIFGAKLLAILNVMDELIAGTLPFSAVLMGGYVFYGGFLGGFAGLIIYTKIFHLSTIDFMDIVCVSIPIGHAFGRVGCFLSGCCYGMATEVDHWYTVYFNNGLDPAAHGAPRVATQLFEAGFLVLLYVVSEILFYKKSKKRLLSTYLYLFAYATWRFIIEFFRDDDRGVVLGLSTSQFISVGIILVAVASILLRKLPIDKPIFKGIDKFLDKSQNKVTIPVEIEEKIVINKDIVYSNRDENVCLLDTYHIPEEGKKYPVMLYIHGGGFIAGDKKHRRGVSKWYASQGLYVFNVNHGLMETTYPTPVIDVVNALNYVVDNAQALSLDLDNIFVSGDSSGAYYASMLTACTVNDELCNALGAEKPKAKIKACVFNCGVYDLEKMMSKPMALEINYKVFKRLTGIKKGDYNAWEYASVANPVEQITSDFPPCFIVSAKKDMFCVGQVEPLIEKLESSGVEFVHYQSKKRSANHCFPLKWKCPDAINANAQTQEFIANKIQK